MLRPIYLLTAGLLLAGGYAADAQRVSDAGPKKNVIMYIGDGFGIAPKTAARLALGQGQPGSRYGDDPNFQLLAIDKLKYNAMATTHSYNGFITDSAPGATCYAAGQNGKIDNDQIAWDPLTQSPVETILEAAKREGYAVGLVTSTRITHATPADFATHVWSRSLENVIAAQYLASSQEEYAALYGADYDTTKHWIFPSVREGVKIDVLLGGGARHFLPRGSNRDVVDRNGVVVNDARGERARLAGRRDDSRDLIAYAEQNLNYKFVNSRDGLMNMDYSQFTPNDNRSLLGLFNDSHTSYEQDRQLFAPYEPSLEDMVKIAIEVLKRKSDKGFFLMVEGGRIDHMEHANVGAIKITQDRKFAIVVDTPTYSPDVVYSANPADEALRIPGIYGSDYLIKEVLDFDHSIAAGRALLNDASAGETLIFQAADHECGGLTVTGLHDEDDFQGNGTQVRTYAERPSNSLGSANAKPGRIDRGDDEIGGWFADYVMYDFQGTMWPRPAGPTARRLVIAYGSNILTNGNSNPGTPGNHTPDDIYVGADDNVGGRFASRITGRGLLDNTDLTPIMSEFLGLSDDFSNFDANLALDIQSSKPTICAFESVSLTVTATNKDIRTARNVKVRLPFTDRTAYMSATTSAGVFRQYGPGGVLIEEWDLGELEPGESATLTLTVFTLRNDALTFTATTTAGADEVGASTTVETGTCRPTSARSEGAEESLESGHAPTTRVSVYPTITNHEVTVLVDSEIAQDADLLVVGLNGAIVLRQSLQASAGVTVAAVSVADLTAGGYVVIVDAGGKRSAQAIVVE